MKKILTQIVIILAFCTTVQADEWLVCDIPVEPVAGYWVSKDGAPAVWIDYQEINGSAALYNVTGIESGTFIASARNEQGRQGEPSDPFVLQAKPLQPGQFRIVLE